MRQTKIHGKRQTNTYRKTEVSPTVEIILDQRNREYSKIIYCLFKDDKISYNVKQ